MGIEQYEGYPCALICSYLAFNAVVLVASAPTQLIIKTEFHDKINLFFFNALWLASFIFVF